MYAHILEIPEMANQVNIHMQYAICIEKTGQLTESIDQCEQRIHECEETGEVEQLKSLQLKVSVLKQFSQNQNQEDVVDITADDPLQDEEVNTGDFFSLDSQEIIPLETKESKPKKVEKTILKEPIVRTILAKPVQKLEPEHVEITEKSISEDRKKQKAANLFGEDEHNIPPHEETSQGLQLVDQDKLDEEAKNHDVWNQHEL
ncbi:MAG: hypothetical protein Q9M46_02730 [Ghiorsea sp.]|nr:hypothetical protein [Ghiorsea sp.]